MQYSTTEEAEKCNVLSTFVILLQAIKQFVDLGIIGSTEIEKILFFFKFWRYLDNNAVLLGDYLGHPHQSTERLKAFFSLLDLKGSSCIEALR